MCLCVCVCSNCRADRHCLVRLEVYSFIVVDGCAQQVLTVTGRTFVTSLDTPALCVFESVSLPDPTQVRSEHSR